MKLLTIEDLLFHEKISTIYKHLCIILLPIVAYFFTGLNSWLEWIKIYIMMAGGCITVNVLYTALLLISTTFINAHKDTKMYTYILSMNISVNTVVGTTIIYRIYHYLKAIGQ